MQFYKLETLSVTGLATLANSGNATSDAIDNTVGRNNSVDIEFLLTGTATTSTTDVDVYLLKSLDGTNYTSTAITGNLVTVDAVTLNTDTAVRRITRLDNLPPYWKLYFVNNSGGALTAATIRYLGIDL
jgi:hypothetical protein